MATTDTKIWKLLPTTTDRKAAPEAIFQLIGYGVATKLTVQRTGGLAKQ